MASSTVIDAAILALAGITNAGTIALLTGLTVAQAAEKYLVAFQLAVANAGVDRGMIKVYTLTGQHVETDVAQAMAMVKFLKAMKSAGGGPVQMGVCLP